MARIQIIYKDRIDESKNTIQQAVESAFRWNTDECGYVVVLDGEWKENVQLYHGVNLYFHNGVTFQGQMTDGGRCLSAVISGNGIVKGFGEQPVFNIQNTNSQLICNCNVLTGSTSAIQVNSLSVYTNDGSAKGSYSASTSGLNIIIGTNNVVYGYSNIVAGSSNSTSGINNYQNGYGNTLIRNISYSNNPDSNIQSGYTNSITGGDNNIQCGYGNKMYLTIGSFNNTQNGDTNYINDAVNNFQSGYGNIINYGASNIQSGAGNMIYMGTSNEVPNNNNIQSGENNLLDSIDSIQIGKYNKQSGAYNIQSGFTNNLTGNVNAQFGLYNTGAISGSLVSGSANTISGLNVFVHGSSIGSTGDRVYAFGNNFTNTDSNVFIVQFGTAKPNLIVSSVGLTGSRIFAQAGPQSTLEMATKGYVDTVAASGATGVTSWGAIIGSISAQTDLQAELDDKPNLNTANTYTSGTQTFQNNLLCAGTTFLQTPTTYGSGLTAYPASNWLIRKSFADTEYTLTGSLVTASSNLSSYINNQVSLRVDKYGDTMFNWLTFIPDGSFNPMRPDLAPVASGVAVCYQYTENRYSTTAHNHALANLSEKSYESLTQAPWIYV